MKYITTGRQYGSGGRQIENLVGKLNIPVYDTELITLARKSGISSEYIEALDEQGRLLSLLLINSSPIGSVIPNYYNIPMTSFFLQRIS